MLPIMPIKMSLSLLHQGPNPLVYKNISPVSPHTNSNLLTCKWENISEPAQFFNSFGDKDGMLTFVRERTGFCRLGLGMWQDSLGSDSKCWARGRWCGKTPTVLPVNKCWEQWVVGLNQAAQMVPCLLLTLLWAGRWAMLPWQWDTKDYSLS